ncbi:glutamate [NMDA] receptor subunit 1-like [Stylophora pistillata]|nr:glutamate [NMDA] receptor subunit 1-like [Stylophora pistillata]
MARRIFLWQLMSCITLEFLTRFGTAVEKLDVNIAVFFDKDDIFQEYVFKSAERMFRSRNVVAGNVTPNEFLLEMHFSMPNLTDVSPFDHGLSGLFPKISNITFDSQGIIFVDVTEDGLLYSTLLESSVFPSIGLLQSRRTFPITQESSGGFTRVAAPSIIEYAQVMVKITEKMGWQTLSLVISATHEGLVFADALKHLAQEKKWRVLTSLWIQGVESLQELKMGLLNVMSTKSDVIIGHVREKSNDDIFWTIQKLQAIENSSAWLVTKPTTYGVLNLSSIPSGLTQVSCKLPEMGHDYELYLKALYDSFVMFESAFKSSVRAINSVQKQVVNTSEKYKLLRRTAMIRLKDTFLKGSSELFRTHDLSEEHHSAFDILNLREDLDSRKHWQDVGLSTPTGLALEPIVNHNGNTLLPLHHPKHPVLRVPVVEWPPLVVSKDPALTASQKSCVGRTFPCYKYVNIENSTQKTKQLLCCYGASIDFLKFLRRDLGFDTEIYFNADRQYGKFDPVNGTWNGIINEIISGKADLALDVSGNFERARVVEFAYPSTASAMNILVRKERSYQEQVSVWYSWLEPFEYGLWIAILVTCNLVLFVVWWLDRKSPKGYYALLKDSDEDAFTLLDSMSYVWGVAFSKDIGAEKTPRSNSARTVSAVYALLALIMVNTYCANLMAFLLEDSYKLPISGIRDAKLTEKSLYPPDGFKLGVTRGSNAESYFKYHVEDFFRKIYHANLKIHLVDGFQAGIQQLKDNKLDGLVGDYLSLQQAGNTDPKCSYSLAGGNFYHFGYGFVFPKGSPWIEEATLSVLKNQENGSIQAILDYWFNKKECTTRPVKELGPEKLIGLFLLLLGVIGFSIMALISEMLFIFVLVKFGRHLGPLGKSLTRMIFSVRKGEENDINIKWLQLYKRHKSMRPNEVQFTEPHHDVSIRRASFCNLSFEYGNEVLPYDEQSIYLRRSQLLTVEDLSRATGGNSESQNDTTERTESSTL